MSRAMPKCKICGQEVDKNDTSSFIKKSGRYIHVSCEKAKKEEKKLVKCHFCQNAIENQEDLVKRGSIKAHKTCLDNYHKSGDNSVVKTKLRTCPKCKEKVDPLSENAIDIENATLHRECYERIQREKKNRQDLLDYISLKYDINFPTGYMLRQISDYHDKRGYSYKAMLTTLKFIFDVERVPIKDGVGVGLIPFYFEKAKAYYSKIRTAGKTASNTTINNKTKKIIAVAENKNRKRRSIDISSL